MKSETAVRMLRDSALAQGPGSHARSTLIAALTWVLEDGQSLFVDGPLECQELMRKSMSCLDSIVKEQARDRAQLPLPLVRRRGKA